MSEQGREERADGAIEVADETLIRVAWYYYKDGLTQAQIAERMGVSRASVGRHLDRARASGLVRIDIEPRALRGFQLARGLCAAFELDDAMVVPDLRDNGELPQDQLNERIAAGAAQYLVSRLSPGTSLGIGYGDTVARTLSACRPSSFDGVQMVTLTGGINAYLVALDGLRSDGILTHATATRIIPTPIMASSEDLAKALRSDRSVNELIEEAGAVDVAITGIGSTSPEATLVHRGLQAPHELAQLADQGYVGDILGLFFDEDGCLCETELSARRIGISAEAFRSLPVRIGVAAGASKLAAIRAALQGRLVTVLVTTESIANSLLDSATTKPA